MGSYGSGPEPLVKETKYVNVGFSSSGGSDIQLQIFTPSVEERA